MVPQCTSSAGLMRKWNEVPVNLGYTCCVVSSACGRSFWPFGLLSTTKKGIKT